MDYQDAAFGQTAPSSGEVRPEVTSAATLPLTAAQVQALQAALNVLGFGPLATNGKTSPELLDATSRYLQSVGKNLDLKTWGLTGSIAAEVVRDAQAKANGVNTKTPPGIKVVGGGTPGTQQSIVAGAPAEPFYKNQKLMLGLAAAGVVAYLMWRSKGESKAAPVKTPEREDDRSPEPGLGSAKPKSRRTKCDRTPDVDFADGEEFTYDLAEES